MTSTNTTSSKVNGGFEIELREQYFRPQSLLSMALLSLLTLDDYGKELLSMPLPEAIARRRMELLRTLDHVDELHEKWLNHRRTEQS